MPQLSIAEVQAAWLRLSQRYGWALLEEETALFERALAEAEIIGASSAQQQLATVCIWRAYGAALYEGLRQRDERAASQLWRICIGKARRDYPPDEAEDLAQETIARVLLKLDTLKSPASLLTWVLQVFRSVARELRESSAAQPYAAAESDAEPADARDIAAEIERRVIAELLRDRLEALLPNPLERETLVRVVLLGEKPRDVARDLGLPLHRTRLAKHRALERVRQDPEFLALLRDLAGREDLDAPGPGADDHDRSTPELE